MAPLLPSSPGAASMPAASSTLSSMLPSVLVPASLLLSLLQLAACHAHANFQPRLGEPEADPLWPREREPEAGIFQPKGRDAGAGPLLPREPQLEYEAGIFQPRVREAEAGIFQPRVREAEADIFQPRGREAEAGIFQGSESEGEPVFDAPPKQTEGEFLGTMPISSGQSVGGEGGAQEGLLIRPGHSQFRGGDPKAGQGGTSGHTQTTEGSSRDSQKIPGEFSGHSLPGNPGHSQRKAEEPKAKLWGALEQTELVEENSPASLLEPPGYSEMTEEEPKAKLWGALEHSELGEGGAQEGSPVPPGHPQQRERRPQGEKWGALGRSLPRNAKSGLSSGRLRQVSEQLLSLVWPPAQSTGRRQLLSDAKWRYREVKRRRRGGDCWSRHEHRLFYKSIPMTDELEEALRRYQLMHQRCTNVSDWNAYADLLFWDKEKQRGSLNGCKYILYIDPFGHGLGNRIINLVSTFALGLVTNRTLLMKHDSPIADFFCNPFRFSNWALNETQWRGFIDNLWRGVRRMDAFASGNIWEGWIDRRMMHISVNWNSKAVSGKFFCPELHKEVFQYIPVISIESDEYFVPALYYTPEFDREFTRLIPDGRVFTHLGRYILHPSNRVWLQVTRYYDAYLAHHSRLVGIQIRKFWPCDIPVDDRIMECAFNISGAIPPVLPYEEYIQQQDEVHERERRRRTGRESVGVFMTSLNRTYSDIVADLVNARAPPDGQLIAVYSLSHEGAESHEKRQHEVALVEMLLLSMCDELLTTDFSTFGYVAAGLSGDLPYSMNIVVHGGGDFRTNGRPACQVISSEPCFHQFPSDQLECSGGPKPLTRVHPEVDVCDGVGTGLAHKIKV